MRIAAALAAFAVLLAGCGGTDTTAGEPTPSGLPDDYEVPAIVDPLDPDRFATDPCALLSDAQRADLELPDTERRDPPSPIACQLHPAGDRITTTQLQIMTDQGLADWVAQCRVENPPAACATWTPTTVEQYPAILDNGGLCRIMVGVAEQAVILVNDREEPECRRAIEIATMALNTLQEGS